MSVGPIHTGPIEFKDPCPPHQFWNSIDSCVKCGMTGIAFSASRVSAPPDRTDTARFIDAVQPFLVAASHAGVEGALYADMLVDFRCWWGSEIAGYTTMPDNAVTPHDETLHKRIENWLSARNDGDWTRPIPSAAKPKNDALPCGCSASMVSAMGHYSNCAESVKALLAIVDDKPKDDGKADWISVTPRSPDAETIHKARAMESALNSPEFRAWHAKNCPWATNGVLASARNLDGPCSMPTKAWPSGGVPWGATDEARFGGRSCAQVFLAEMFSLQAKPTFSVSGGASFPAVAPGATFSAAPSFLDDKVTWKVRLGGLMGPGAVKAVALTPKVSPDLYGSQLDSPRADKGPDRIASRVTGCARCRIRRFGAFCNGCGDRVTSFDLRDGESGW